MADQRPHIPGATVEPTRDWLATLAGYREDGRRIGAELLSGFALLYTLFAVANTTIMSFSRRSAEFTQLRMLGASRGQVLCMTLWEATASRPPDWSSARPPPCSASARSGNPSEQSGCTYPSPCHGPPSQPSPQAPSPS